MDHFREYIHLNIILQKPEKSYFHWVRRFQGEKINIPDLKNGLILQISLIKTRPVNLLAGAPTNVVKPFTFILECLNTLGIFLFDPEII